MNRLRYLVLLVLLLLVTPHAYAQSHSVTLKATSILPVNIYRGTVSSGPYTKLNTTPLASPNYVDLAVNAGGVYYYVATAINSAGVESIYSNEVMTTVPGGITPPPPPPVKYVGGTSMGGSPTFTFVTPFASQSLTIWDNGPDTAVITVTGSSDKPWLTFTPVSANTAYPLAVNVSPTGQPSGTQTGHIILSSPGWSNTITLIVNATFPAPPPPPPGVTVVCTTAAKPVCTVSNMTSGQTLNAVATDTVTGKTVNFTIHRN